MSIKVKQAIENCLIKIDQKTFDEDTIRTLLISSREYIKPESLIKELAHFIAHPSRNQGIFHKKINARYTKFKLVQEQFSKHDIETISKNIKNEDELSDFLLSGVNVNKIDAKLFKILYQDGLDDLPEEHLLKYTGFTKLAAQKLLKDSYTKIENYYYLNVLKTEKMITLLKQFPDDYEIQLTIKKSTELISNIRNANDAIQKVIRGAIHFRSVFETQDLIDEIQTYFLEVLNQFQIDKKYLQIIIDNIEDILLCILCLLHDSKFIFYDKNEARVSLKTYLEDSEIIQNNSNLTSKELLYEYGVIALYIKFKTADNKSMSVPLFVSDLKLNTYVTSSDFFNSKINSSIEEITWINAKRLDGEIRLTE